MVSSSSGVRAGVLSVLLAAVLWGTTGTVRSFADASPLSVAAARIILGGALLCLVARRGLASVLTVPPGRLLLAAACLAVYHTAFFAAVAQAGVAAGSVLALGSAPVFAALFTGSPRRAVLVAGLSAGILVFAATGCDPVGLVLALVTGVFNAGYAVAAGRLLRDGLSEPAVAASTFGLAGFLLAPVFAATGPGWVLSPSGAAVALYLGVVTTAGGYLLYVRGLRTVSAATATTVTLAEPAVAAFLGIVVLHEL
ncbi:DMT family transporter [Actinocorallia longicatena]|uniref:DMT family transporter n=1 Tax=Actinocorallia longicatena TaxID=111803 RepID=A0ABP6Q841_9ACTN